MQAILPYLSSLTTLVQESAKDDKNVYVHPAFKNLGAVSMVLIREAIGPVIFRNAEQEITDIEIEHEVHVRAVPNKFKFIERNRGLQILRYFGTGGRLPQNKTVFRKGQKISEVYDLNTLVFGDSAMQEARVLSVKAAVNYSDALSIQPKEYCVDETFHNRAFEDGTLFDATEKKNSDNLFNRHFIEPGTLMVQVLSTRGKVLPPEGLDHLLLCIGFAGAYGGQTSITGTNIRTHVVGVYADQFEQAESSPYELIRQLRQQKLSETDQRSVETVKSHLHKIMTVSSPETSTPSADVESSQRAKHAACVSGNEAHTYLQNLMQKFDQDELRPQYQEAQEKVGNLFVQWFGK